MKAWFSRLVVMKKIFLNGKVSLSIRKMILQVKKVGDYGRYKCQRSKRYKCEEHYSNLLCVSSAQGLK